MVEVSRSLHVKAKPDRVIEYIADVENHPAFIPPLKSVANLAGDPKRRGSHWDWTFTMGGVQLTGKAETVDYVPGQRFGFRTSGIDSTFSYQVEPEGSGSKLTVKVSYDVPQSVLAKIADRAVVVRMNEKDADQAAKNLQTILDGE
jgi:carbon monoxide dehydrogenase subunit G